MMKGIQMYKKRGVWSGYVGVPETPIIGVFELKYIHAIHSRMKGLPHYWPHETAWVWPRDGGPSMCHLRWQGQWSPRPVIPTRWVGLGNRVSVPGEGVSSLVTIYHPMSPFSILGTGFGGVPRVKAGFCPVSLLLTLEAGSGRYIGGAMSCEDIGQCGGTMSHKGFPWTLDGRGQEQIFSFKMLLFHLFGLIFKS